MLQCFSKTTKVQNMSPLMSDQIEDDKLKVRDDPSFMVDLATGRGAASLLRHKFSSLTARFQQKILLVHFTFLAALKEL